MTKPLFYSAELIAGTPDQLVTLDAAASAHAVRSQRLTVGDYLLVSDGAGALGHGILEDADPTGAVIRVPEVMVQPPPTVRINLVQALAKGDRDLLAAEMATELGVDSVTPWQAHRSIVRLRAERAAKTLAKWEAKLQAAAQQARRTVIPELQDVVVGQQLAEFHEPAQQQHLVVLHEDGDQDIAQLSADTATIDTIHLAVGPEGGVSREEIEAVHAVGGSLVKIGSRVMRASTAGPVAIALLNEMFNRW